MINSYLPLLDKKVYTLGDMPDAKLGDVGDLVEAIVLHYYHDNGNLILGPNDVVAVQAIYVDMQETVNIHCFIDQLINFHNNLLILMFY